MSETLAIDLGLVSGSGLRIDNRMSSPLFVLRRDLSMLAMPDQRALFSAVRPARSAS